MSSVGPVHEEVVPFASKVHPTFVQDPKPESKFSKYGAWVHVNKQEPSFMLAKES